MIIKKTVGMAYTAGERKSYCIITKCGEEIECHAEGSQGFKCNGVKYQSLKDIKAAVESWGAVEEAEVDEVSSTMDGHDTWDCIHPCALLIKWTKSHSPESLKTLSNYGWLDCIGRPDVARAEREIKRIENLAEYLSDNSDPAV